MQKLLTVLLLSLSFSVLADTRQIRICDQYQHCQIITVYDQSATKPSESLLNAIANSGSKNFETINRGWNPQQYRNQYRNY